MQTLRIFLVLLLLATPAFAKPDAAQEKKADESIKKMLTYLRGKQNADGSWSTRAGPAITSMVVSAMLDQPGIDKDDEHVKKGLAYVLSKVQKDGSIHDGILENYNTSICLAMLAKLSDPKIKEIVENGRKWLKASQYHEGMTDAKGNKIDKNHPWFGGTGYGKGGRPDGSNTHITIEAFMETGSDCKDPEIVAAVEFFTRLQGTKANKAGGNIVQDGGAVYTPATGETDAKDKGKGKGGSGAGEVVDADGKSRLRTYGSMTYAMFKTYVYAQLAKDDPRVIDAKKWIAHNYTIERNPGMPEQQKMSGYFYYLMTFARALDANKEDVIVDAKGGKHNWANDLIDHLTKIQKPDGSFANDADRYMEGDPVMVTAMALTSISAARY